MPGQKKSDKVEEGAKIGPRGQNGPSALEITVAGVWTAAAPLLCFVPPTRPWPRGGWERMGTVVWELAPLCVPVRLCLKPRS